MARNYLTGPDYTTANVLAMMPQQQPAWTVPGNGVGLLGKLLGGLGLDASGARRAQSWGNAGRQSLYDLAHLPDTMLESTAQAVTAPVRAYRGEISDDQMLPEGLNVAGAMAVGGSAFPRPAGAAGMFGGRLAKTADHAALARAEEMAAKGTPRETIWDQTGWFQGADKKWRFEIDDSGSNMLLDYGREQAMRRARAAGLSDEQIAAIKGTGGPLAEHMFHPALDKSYPEIGKTYFAPLPSTSPRLNGVRGIYDKSGIGVNSEMPNSAIRSTTLHEQQHALQSIEGFASGGNPRMFSPAEIDAERARLMAQDTMSDKGWGSVGGFSGDASDLDVGRSLYNRLAGEVEARTVQKRMDMTEAERRARPPWLDYDVPEGQQIVRGLFSNPDSAAAPGLLATGAAKQAEQPKGFTAYHGSPHDFDRFVFDDKLIEILRKYGLLGTLGGGAAAMSGGGEAQAAPYNALAN